VLDLEIVVFVEINTASDEWATLKNALASRGFKFIEGSGGNQRVVLAYDDDEVDLLATAESAEPDVRTSFSRGECSTSNARKPLFGNFRAGQFDFTVIGVHLKSGLRPKGCPDDTFTAFVRGEQASDVLAEIGRREQAGSIDQDIILVGDFNAGLDDASLNKLRGGGFRVLTEEANRSPSSGSLSYRKGSFRSVLDHIAARPVTDREWVARSTMYLPALTTMSEDELAKFRQRFSDHSPAWTEFRVGLPDDD
jgi:predicted extracellular nuclease